MGAAGYIPFAVWFPSAVAGGLLGVPTDHGFVFIRSASATPFILRALAFVEYTKTHPLRMVANRAVVAHRWRQGGPSHRGRSPGSPNHAGVDGRTSLLVGLPGGQHDAHD